MLSLTSDDEAKFHSCFQTECFVGVDFLMCHLLGAMDVCDCKPRKLCEHGEIKVLLTEG